MCNSVCVCVSLCVTAKVRGKEERKWERERELVSQHGSWKMHGGCGVSLLERKLQKKSRDRVFWTLQLLLSALSLTWPTFAFHTLQLTSLVLFATQPPVGFTTGFTVLLELIAHIILSLNVRSLWYYSAAYTDKVCYFICVGMQPLWYGYNFNLQSATINPT